ncbi:MAG: hypothetical protein ABL861_09935 [Nitrosomonas sp.]
MPKYITRIVITITLFSLICIILSGCAVYYRDRDSGIEHIWGFGHLSVKVTAPSEEKQAIIQRTTLTGVSTGLDNGSLGMSVGYDRREHIIIYDENTVITIQRPPSNDFFYFKIGSLPIELNKQTGTTDTNNHKEK